MALLKNNLAEWVDIKKLFIRTSQERTRFGQSAITIPELKNQVIDSEDISTLSSLINDLSSNSFLGSVASTSSVSLPSSNSLLTPLALNSLSTILTNIESKVYTTAHCGTYFNAHRTRAYGNSGNCPAYFSGHDFSFDSSDDSGFCFHCSSFCSPDGGDSSFFRCGSGFTWFSGTNAPFCGSFENGAYSDRSFNGTFGSKRFSCSTHGGTCGCFNDFNEFSFNSGYFSTHFSAFHTSAYFASGFTTAFNAAGFCPTFNASAFADTQV